MKVGFDAAAFMSTTLAAGERSGGGRVSMGEGVRNFALIMNVRRLVLHRCDLAGNRPCWQLKCVKTWASEADQARAPEQKHKRSSGALARFAELARQKKSRVVSCSSAFWSWIVNRGSNLAKVGKRRVELILSEKWIEKVVMIMRR